VKLRREHVTGFVVGMFFSMAAFSCLVVTYVAVAQIMGWR
jgi:hypothetical protein